ncbi:OmpA family protein [Shimia ponticola]|uniref:OmpA family protein n=1 Tax=Shimia ponticola TaxID=2582893 RepID=UPI0011BF0FBD|nr:OmpA family protein [Shimia ponticola]
MIRHGIIAAWLCLWAGCAGALELSVPSGAEVTSERSSSAARVSVPSGPYRDGFLPVRDTAGDKVITAYRVPQPGITALDLIAPLEDQLVAGGYRVLLGCETFDCGGFDFRFAIEVLPPPAMFVDLGEFAYVSAVSERGEDFVMALASRTLDVGFLQITRVNGSGTAVNLTTSQSSNAPVSNPVDAETGLDQAGHVVLSDLSFATGTTNLSEGSYASLAALAEYLTANPSRRIALVGHTDASGSLEINLQVSRARAEAVRARLIAVYGIAADRVEAEGVGYLSPRASNLSDEGRAANRRVEAVVISTE